MFFENLAGNFFWGGESHFKHIQAEDHRVSETLPATRKSGGGGEEEIDVRGK